MLSISVPVPRLFRFSSVSPPLLVLLHIWVQLSGAALAAQPSGRRALCCALAVCLLCIASPRLPSSPLLQDRGSRAAFPCAPLLSLYLSLPLRSRVLSHSYPHFQVDPPAGARFFLIEVLSAGHVQSIEDTHEITQCIVLLQRLAHPVDGRFPRLPSST